jgi:copper transport protein
MRSMSSRAGLRRATLIVASIAAVLVVLVPAAPASAHTAFASSDPADGAVVATPVDRITIAFTGPANAIDEGFSVLGPDGVIRSPDDVVVGLLAGSDDAVFTLVFRDPLAGGTVGVRWAVQSADSHVIEGSFSFEVTAPPPTTVPPTTVAPGTSAPAVVVPPTGASPTSSPSTVPPTTAAHGAGDHGADHGGLSPEEHAAADPDGHADLAEFLHVDHAAGAALGRVGRSVGFGGVLLAVGVAVFLAFVATGRAAELATLGNVVRGAGMATTLGAFAELWGLMAAGVEASDVLSSSTGIALLLRICGGVALAAGLGGRFVDLPREPRGASLSAAVVTESPAGVGDHVRWAPDRESVIAVLGAVAVVVSFAFDGHTVSRGIRILHAAASIVHVAAAAVWVGGVVALAIMLWGRHRRSEPSDAAAVFVRYSSVATVALVAVAAAGVVMALQILDAPSEILDSEWGRTLAIKLGAVAVAASLGAYNHLVLRPVLAADPDNERAAASARSVLTSEAIVLGFVVVVTAFLVALAP